MNNPLTVTAQSLVDCCKALASGKESLPSDPYVKWKPASSEEMIKRSVRETGLPPTREETQSEGELISCPRCGGEAHKLVRRDWVHYWCDDCATSAGDDGRALYSNGAGIKDAQI